MTRNKMGNKLTKSPAKTTFSKQLVNLEDSKFSITIQKTEEPSITPMNKDEPKKDNDSKILAST